MRLIMLLEKLGRPYWIGLSLILLVSVALISHYLIQYGASVSLFYLIPIVLATWFVGLEAGGVMALASASIWLLDDIWVGFPGLSLTIHFWNAVVRLFFFELSVFAIHLGRAYEDQRAIAYTDFLSGTFNRRFFHILAQKEIDRSARYRRPFTIAYLDIDNFKRLNDTFGHSSGDRCLQAIARIVQEHLRRTDVVARMGGDEFAILLPETSQAAARAVLSKTHALLLEAAQTNAWPITVSIGVLTFLTPPASIDEMLGKVDSEMYAVKRRGKNGISYSSYPA
ncbi:MAG TPA: GGDEF domain-containing protein [Anaerolineales bacterium]|nr:GGDEF domain-containing protein [Anaerolineales bacterium]